MQTPEPHPQEARRQRALQDLNLLDTPIEERFERITRDARRMLRMPIAAVSLVDDKRQWFKSVQGLDVDQTPRGLSFCGHAVLGEGPFVVRDAARDERFADNPLVRDEPWIRFYAGHPLRAADGLPVGTLCVADRKARRFGVRCRGILAELAREAEAELRARPPSEVQRKLVCELQAARAGAVDALTRLWGREAILEILERELGHARREGTGLGALVIDVDRGDAPDEAPDGEVADAVLRAAARRLLRALRPQDALGRFGSGEFLGVLSGVSRAELGVIAQRIRTRVSRAPLRTPRGRREITVSLGGAWAPASDLRTPGPLLDAASYALCNVQQRGGNRVEVRAP